MLKLFRARSQSAPTIKRDTMESFSPQDTGQTSPMKVITGLSGGVDSSVSALLLLEQGYEVEGLFMKNWDEDDNTEYCTALQDFEDASKVAETLGIPLHTANFATEYWDRVFEHFLAEYKAGRTPNPDVLCNKEIKFKVFLDYAKHLGAKRIATGHYARIQRHPSSTHLYKGLDPQKDQSYFLHQLTQEQLSNSLFPLGKLQKSDVRAIARRAQLTNANKKDSTGICFIGERRFQDFLARYFPNQPGNIVSTEGHTLGEHNGLMYYTIGQRQGLGIGGVAKHPEKAWYVVEKKIQENLLVVAQGLDHPALYHNNLQATKAHWMIEPVHNEFNCSAKIRYRQADQDCTVHIDQHNILQVQFRTPQRAVTPGQYIVFYDQDHCLGGATIKEATCT